MVLSNQEVEEEAADCGVEEGNCLSCCEFCCCCHESTIVDPWQAVNNKKRKTVFFC